LRIFLCIPYVKKREINFIKKGKEVSNLTKQEAKSMTKQFQESNQRRIWVEEFDEEDWEQLFRYMSRHVS
jgi:hypothetical protein